MKVTVIEHGYKLDTIPFVEDEMAIIDGEDMVMFAHHYCIVGACFSGAHFISETFDSYDDAADVFAKYVEVVRYFDGGSCSLYEYSFDNEVALVLFELI
jgi:hypothetical protein